MFSGQVPDEMPDLAGLDEFRDGDVDDALAAGLRTGDAQQAVHLTRSALARRARELVAEKCVVFIVTRHVTVP